MRILADGKVGIGINAPTTELDVVGTIKASVSITAPNMTGVSDMRFKKNIKPVDNALKKIMQLNGIYFNWRSEEFEQFENNTKQNVGFLAQEVEKVIPQVVHTDDTEEAYKSVDYASMVSVLVEAMKEQQQQIEALQKEVDELKKKK